MSRPEDGSSATSHAGANAPVRRRARTEGGSRQPETSWPRDYVITGSSGTLGRLLVARLLDDEATRSIIGVDVRAAGDVGDRRFDFRRADVASGRAALEGTPPGASWLHLAFPLDPQHDAADILRVAVDGTTAVLEAAERAQATKVVVFSSTMVYGTRASGAPFTEDSPLAPPPGIAYAEGKRLLETIAGGWRSAATEVAIARPCTVLGAGIGRHGLMAEFLGERSSVVDHDPRVQFLHPDDLVDGALGLLAPGAVGPFNLTPSDDGVRTSELCRLLGLDLEPIRHEDLRREREIAWAAARPGALHPSVVDYLVHEWVASNARARARLGFAPRWSSLEAFWSYLRAYHRQARTGRSAAR